VSVLYSVHLRRHAIERFFVAYAVGAAVGAAALGVEVLATAHTPLTLAALAGYSLVAGLVAAVSRSILALVLPAPAARMGGVAAIVGFGALHLLYYANVKLLPAEPYYTRKSLAVDVLILAALAVPTLILSRSSRAQEMRYRFGPLVALTGLLLAIFAPAILAASWPPNPLSPERGGRGPDLVLIVVDSLRGDRGAATPVASRATPRLHELAAANRVYDEAYASSSWTVPSVTHLLGADDPGGSTLAERLARQGYATACFTDNPHLTAHVGALRGFDRVDRSVRRWRSLLRDTVVGEVLERVDPGDDGNLAAKAIAWTARRRGPYFLYVHLMDSHTPYRFAPIDGKRRRGRRVEFPVSGMRLTAEEADDIVARYDGGLHSADAQAGRIVDALRASGRPFLAVITADHGESLGESGRWFHGQSLAPELLSVPLVVLGQGVVPGRVTGPIGNTAIESTLLAAAGARCPECRGEDLRAQAGSRAIDGGLPPQLAFRIAGRYKLVMDLQTRRRQLFDRIEDPGERHDLAGERTIVAEAMTAGLNGVATEPRPDPESLERLRALGYAGS